jgi:hypothetical protein
MPVGLESGLNGLDGLDVIEISVGVWGNIWRTRLVLVLYIGQHSDAPGL